MWTILTRKCLWHNEHHLMTVFVLLMRLFSESSKEDRYQVSFLSFQNRKLRLKFRWNYWISHMTKRLTYYEIEGSPVGRIIITSSGQVFITCNALSQLINHCHCRLKGWDESFRWSASRMHLCKIKYMNTHISYILQCLLSKVYISTEAELKSNIPVCT